MYVSCMKLKTKQKTRIQQCVIEREEVKSRPIMPLMYSVCTERERRNKMVQCGKEHRGKTSISLRRIFVYRTPKCVNFYSTIIDIHAHEFTLLVRVYLNVNRMHNLHPLMHHRRCGNLSLSIWKESCLKFI